MKIRNQGEYFFIQTERQHRRQNKMIIELHVVCMQQWLFSIKQACTLNDVAFCCFKF